MDDDPVVGWTTHDVVMSTAANATVSRAKKAMKLKRKLASIFLAFHLVVFSVVRTHVKSFGVPSQVNGIRTMTVMTSHKQKLMSRWSTLSERECRF